MRVPWTARRPNQSILKEISPGISLEGKMLKLKLQYFGHLMRRVDSLEKTPMLGGIVGRRRGRQRMRWLDGITNSGAYSNSCPLSWCDAIQPSHPLSSPSPALYLSQHQGLFKSVSSSHQVAKELEFQLQHQFFQ